MATPRRFWPVLAGLLAAGVVIVLTAWAFAAHRNPDRVGDFASFLQMCAAVLAR